MKTRLLFVALASILVVGTAHAAPTQLKVVLTGAPEDYQCSDKTRLNVKYYRLSDNSLYFVKVKMAAKPEMTLPRVVSASGAKYSDDLYMTWWTKGDSGIVFLSNNGPEADWPLSHRDCVTLGKRR